jgi:hypothetical protein
MTIKPSNKELYYENNIFLGNKTKKLKKGEIKK